MSDEKKFSRFRKITERSSLERGQGLPGTIAASGKPQWFTDLPGHPNFPRSIGALESGLRTGFGFPVFLRGELVAILEFFTDKDIPEDRDLLENVAYMGIQLGRVAERQAAELEESRLAALVERSSDFIITTDPEGKVLYLNQAGKRMVGLEDHPNLQALKREDFIFPDDIPRLNTEVLAVMTRTGHWEGEFRLKNFKTGAAVPVYFSATALLDPATGQPAILAAIGHDITERKKAELAIQESEQKFRLLVANTPDYALYLLDPEGRVITWNEGAEKLKGYTAAEIIGRNYSIFFTEEDHERGIPQALLKEAETKGRATYETRHIRKDGSVFWADSVLTSVVNPEGRLQGFAKITHDVTERQERAVKLREADLRFRSLVQSSTNAIIIADGQGLILSWNRGARDIFGHEEPEVIGQPLTLIMPERYREAHRAGLRHLFETGVGRLMGQTLELQGLRKNGEEFPIELTLSNWSVEGQTYFGGIIRDITERKKVEELLRSNSELQQFANIASHDLQEPLRMVSSYVQLLSARYGDRLDEDARDYIAFAVDGAKRMHQLINALLEYSRVQGRPNPFERVDLNKVFDQVVLDLAMRIQETGAKITHGPLPEVKADTAQMAQLLQNLFVNAMKFRKKDINPVIHLSAAEEKGEWVFTCQDNGIGIDPKYAERIFMIFQRLHHREEYEGTGMGLAICKRIVERHGGRIWVESKPGEGASFRFTFPMTN
jgi:PAS domain S-box-containing protein